MGKTDHIEPCRALRRRECVDMGQRTHEKKERRCCAPGGEHKCTVDKSRRQVAGCSTFFLLHSSFTQIVGDGTRARDSGDLRSVTLSLGERDWWAAERVFPGFGWKPSGH